MNNDLEQFSEERLKYLADGNKQALQDEIEMLARIALAAKQAKPVAFTSLRWLETRDKVEAYTAEDLFDEKYAKNGMKSVPLYTTPQPSHTEQDGWTSFNDAMPTGGVCVLCLTTEGGYRIAFYHDGSMQTGFDDDQCILTHWMPLPAAPKPESE